MPPCHPHCPSVPDARARCLVLIRTNREINSLHLGSLEWPPPSARLFCRRARSSPKRRLFSVHVCCPGSERNPTRQTKCISSRHFCWLQAFFVPLFCLMPRCCLLQNSSSGEPVKDQHPGLSTQVRLLTTFHPRSGRPCGSSSRRKCLPRDFNELQLLS